jgi:LPS export ABC transporter protein LptC
MQFLRLALRAAAGLVLFFTVWLLWPMELDSFVTGRGGQLATPDYSMTNAHYVSVKGGVLEMESRAQDSVYDLAERKMVSQNVTAHFYNAMGKPTVVSADQATMLQEQRKMVLVGNVRSESPDGFLLKGSQADYFMDKKFLVAPKPIEAYSKDESLRVWSNRAESNLNDRKLLLLGDARAQFTEKKRGLTKIRGDRAEIDREKDQILFQKNVRTEQDKIVGTSNSAEISYAGKEKQLKYMSLLEDVKIDQGEGRYTRSQVAEFFAPTDTIVLSGFPSVYNRDDAVTGDRITLYRGTGVVEVTQTNAAASGGPALPGAKKPKPAPLTKEDEELIP